VKPAVSTVAARVILGALAIALLSPFSWFTYHSQSQLVELDQSGLEATGRVSRTQCKNHGRVSYTFNVAGKSFGGEGACFATCATARPGDAVKVLYARSNPKTSTCESLSHLRDKVRGNYIGLGLGAAVLFVLIFRVTRMKGLELS
jgi:hypothetical protein